VTHFRTPLILASFALMTLASGLGACADEELFIDCPFSNSIETSCSSLDDTVAFTCVVESHPFCLEEICASWEGSRSFCTQPCEIDVDCPAESTCRESLNLSFCVPNAEVAVSN
jgi:hypothetical protein